MTKPLLTPARKKRKRKPRKWDIRAKRGPQLRWPGNKTDREVLEETVDWIENLEISEGAFDGQPFELVPFQDLFLTNALRLEIKEAGLSVGRGNGKSTLSAAIATAFFVGPLAQKRGQIVVVAASLGQARIIFNHFYWFLKKDWFDKYGTGTSPKARFRVNDNSHHLEIVDKEIGTSFRCIGGDPQKAHGLSPTLILADEPAQWARNFGPRMYAAISTALGKRRGARLIAIGTQPDHPNHWFSKLLRSGDTGMYGQLHAPDPKADNYSIETIKEANPGWEYWPDLQAELYRQQEKAKAGGDEAAMYEALYLNKGTPDTMATEVICTQEAWAANERSKLPEMDGPVFVGIDPGETLSMTAFAAYWPKTGRTWVRGAFGVPPSLKDRGIQDGVGARYLHMQKHGEIITYPTEKVPTEVFLLQCLKDIAVLPNKDDDPRPQQELGGLVSDRYDAGEVRSAMRKCGYDPDFVTFRATGPGPEGIDDIRKFQTAVAYAGIHILPQISVQSAIAESEVSRDRRGNPHIDKSRQKGRIDILQALIHAVAAGWRFMHPEDEDIPPMEAEDFLLNPIEEKPDESEPTDDTGDGPPDQPKFKEVPRIGAHGGDSESAQPRDSESAPRPGGTEGTDGTDDINVEDLPDDVIALGVF